MDEVRNSSNSERYTPSSEPFRIYTAMRLNEREKDGRYECDMRERDVKFIQNFSRKS
jgi:hypothetical protein